MTARYQVVLTPRAFGDLTHIRDYLIERSPTGADNVRQAINTTLDPLSDQPGLGRDRPELGVRSVGVPIRIIRRRAIQPLLRRRLERAEVAERHRGQRIRQCGEIGRHLRKAR